MFMLQINTKDKTKITRCVILMLILFAFIIIFLFSSENSDKSEGTSNKVIDFIININPYTKNLSNIQKNELSKKMLTPIRKLAHFSIYTVVGATVMSYMCTYDIDKKNKIYVTLGIGMIYAISDEIHQLFVSGRTGRIIDVLIDTIGVLFGIGIVIIIRKRIKSRKKSN